MNTMKMKIKVIKQMKCIQMKMIKTNLNITIINNKITNNNKMNIKVKMNKKIAFIMINKKMKMKIKFLK